MATIEVSVPRFIRSAGERVSRLRGPRLAAPTIGAILLIAGAIGENRTHAVDFTSQKLIGGARFAYAVVDNAWYGTKKTVSDGLKIAGDWSDPTPKNRALDVDKLGLKDPR